MRFRTLFSTTAALLTVVSASRAAERLSLDGAWEFRQQRSADWLPATVPGCVHTDLLALGRIPDPFYGENEKRVQWVGEKDWEYRRTFRAGAELLAEERIELVMEGIDTYAEVWLNGHCIGRCDNMFRTWRIDVKPWLQAADNELLIRFSSVYRVDLPKYLDAPYRRMAWPNNDQSDIWLSLYARKAGYHYGWDWGPRLLTAGIWRSIGIEGWSGLRVAAAQIKTLSLPTKRRDEAELEADCLVEAVQQAEALITVTCNGKEVSRFRHPVEPGENRIRTRFRVAHPQLWWCNGAGEQPLYDFGIRVESAGCAAAGSVRTGIRTVEIVREADEQGRSMYVRLNGRPIFMKGANYIPTDNFPTRTGDAGYERIVRAAAAAQMNMLRVWGGGIYESDSFYDWCDRCGILVWQDMMFACGMFPADEAYLQSVAAEVRDNVRRLRNHPCIALWNGNNENEISYYEWGWQRTLTPEQDRDYQAGMHRLFRETIPAAIAAEDDTRYYHPTSPDTGYNGIGYDAGDVHYWAVWKGAWIEEYERPENIGRFMSEYGFQSYPALRTLRRTIPADQLRVGSPAMLSHQKAHNDATRDPNFGDQMMQHYLQHYLAVPQELGEFVYASQLMQAEAIKIGIEAHRRAKPRCMGSLYWQINDCWPVASWSGIDWYGCWKPLQYYAARAFGELLVSPFRTGDRVCFRIVSDRATPFAGELLLRSYTPDGTLLSEYAFPVQVAADGTADAAELACSALGAGLPDEGFFTAAELREKGKTVAENCFYPALPNRYRYADAEPEITIEPVAGGVRLTLSSPVLIRGLWLEVEDEATHFATNALTLVPNRPQTVDVRTELSAEAFREQLSWHSFNRLLHE